MQEITPELIPTEFLPHFEPLLNLIHAQQALQYPYRCSGGSSHYYEAMYSDAYASMETVMSAAVKHGNALQEELDTMALGSVDTLMKVVKGS